MENPIGAKIRVVNIKLPPKSEGRARVTFELDFGEERRKKPLKISIWTQPENTTTASALSSARNDMAKCLTLMANTLKQPWRRLGVTMSHQ